MDMSGTYQPGIMKRGSCRQSYVPVTLPGCLVPESFVFCGFTTVFENHLEQNTAGV